MGILGLHRVLDLGFRGYIGFYRGCVGIMEKKLEITIYGSARHALIEKSRISFHPPPSINHGCAINCKLQTLHPKP